MDHYEPERLLELAASKDAGFTIDTFLDALNAIKRLTPDDWLEDGVDDSLVDGVQQVFLDWHARLCRASSD
jgi:hypothetical protein